jgi:glutamine cyclotransferase
MIFTGMYGESDVRLVHLETGEVEARTRLPGHHFGEGLAKLGDRLYQLTWERPDGFIYSTQDVQKVCGGMRQV